MKKTISAGRSDFTKMINKNNFYVDKTRFIVEWYKEDRDVTLITRPRRFGKTLTLSMLERFFSLKYANQDEIFHGLDVSTDPEIMKLQGTMPVIKMSFSSMNPKSYDDFLDSLSAEVVNAYKEYQYLLNDDIAELDKEEITTIIKPRLNNEKKRVRLSNTEIYLGIKELCRILFEKYGKKALVLLDEYDTPLQTAYLEGYWTDACGFITQMFDAIFKTNDYIEYGIITGITRIAKESIFSKLNNLDVCTVNTNKYEDIFGFTEQEVIGWLGYYNVSDRLDEVRDWYDGYRFGSKDNMYNPFSFANYLDIKKPAKYWANVSSNALISDLLRNGNVEVKKQCEELLQGRSIEAIINEEVTFNDLRTVQDSTLSLMVASGYLKAKLISGSLYQLSIVNHEVSEMMDELIAR